MTSSGRLTSTEKIGCTMLIRSPPSVALCRPLPRWHGPARAVVRSVVVAIAAAARDHDDRGDGGADGGCDQRRLDGLLGDVAARGARIAAQALLRDAGTFAHRGDALVGEVLHAVAQVAHLVESVVGERLGAGLGAGRPAGNGHVAVLHVVAPRCERGTGGGAVSQALRGQAYVAAPALADQPPA